MARKRFRWTRARYYKAHRLSRYFDRHVYDLPSDPPVLLRLFWDLMKGIGRSDPLLTPMRLRERYQSDDIPF